MAHVEQMRFFQSVVDSFEKHFQGKVLDIGSLDIGGGPHKLFRAAEYIGVDLGPGDNVHLVSGGQDVDLQSNFFDVVMSSECFEHNPYWRSTFHNMVRMAKQGGIIVFSCAGFGRPEHGTSRSEPCAAPLAIQIGQEYYANVRKKEVIATIDEFAFSNYAIFENHVTCDLYFVGVKNECQQEDIENLMSLIENYKKYLRRHGSWLMVIIRLLLRPFWKFVNKVPLAKSLLRRFFKRDF